MNPIVVRQLFPLEVRRLRGVLNGCLADSLYPSSDGVESEVGGIDFIRRKEEQVGGIVHRPEVAGVCHRAAVEHVQRMYGESGIDVDVGQREEVFRAHYVQPRLFLHLTGYAFFARLEHVDEAAGQVERAFGGFFGAAAHQQLAPFVENQGDGGGRGIEVIDETAVGALLRLFVVDPEAGGAAFGAVVELGKRMFHACESFGFGGQR